MRLLLTTVFLLSLGMFSFSSFAGSSPAAGSIASSDADGIQNPLVRIKIKRRRYAYCAEAVYKRYQDASSYRSRDRSGVPKLKNSYQQWKDVFEQHYGPKLYRFRAKSDAWRLLKHQIKMLQNQKGMSFADAIKEMLRRSIKPCQNEMTALLNKRDHKDTRHLNTVTQPANNSNKDNRFKNKPLKRTINTANSPFYKGIFKNPWAATWYWTHSRLQERNSIYSLDAKAPYSKSPKIHIEIRPRSQRNTGPKCIGALVESGRSADGLTLYLRPTHTNDCVNKIKQLSLKVVSASEIQIEVHNASGKIAYGKAKTYYRNTLLKLPRNFSGNNRQQKKSIPPITFRGPGFVVRGNLLITNVASMRSGINVLCMPRFPNTFKSRLSGHLGNTNPLSDSEVSAYIGNKHSGFGIGSRKSLITSVYSRKQRNLVSTGKILNIGKLRRKEAYHDFPVICAAPDKTILAQFVKGRSPQQLAKLFLLGIPCSGKPFCNLPAGQYLNAIYQNNVDQVRIISGKQAAYNRKGFNRLTSGTRSNPLIQLLGRIGKFKLIKEVANKYMFDYKYWGRSCLNSRPSSKTFEDKAAPRYSEPNRFSGVRDRLSSGHHYKATYKNNQNFASLRNRIGRATGAITSSRVSRHGGPLTQQIFLGIEQMRQKYNCNSPEVKQFERNLIRMTNLYLRNPRAWSNTGALYRKMMRKKSGTTRRSQNRRTRRTKFNNYGDKYMYTRYGEYAAKHPRIKRTSSNLPYYITYPGQGRIPKASDKVVIHILSYTVRNKDRRIPPRKVLDTKTQGKPFIGRINDFTKPIREVLLNARSGSKFQMHFQVKHTRDGKLGAIPRSFPDHNAVIYEVDFVKFIR